MQPPAGHPDSLANVTNANQPSGDSRRQLLPWAIVIGVAVVPPVGLLILGYTHYVSTTVQLVGTLVTGYGLFYAYGRATGLAARLREWWANVRHKPRNIIIDAAPLLISVSLSAADVHVGFKLDENATIDEKFAHLEGYVRELRGMFGSVNAAIERLDKAIEQAKKHADTAAAQALTDAKVELQGFSDRINKLQAVDLSIAAVGAFIMAGGYALSYFGCLRF